MVFSKFYFVDFSVHSFEEITHNISNLSKNDGIVLRKFDKRFYSQAIKILKLCKSKRIEIFCHFENKILKNLKKNTHFASSNKTHAIYSASIHSQKDIKKFTANVVFISPLFKTKTHPDAKPLRKIQATKIALKIRKLSPKTKIYFLGGMNQSKFRKIYKTDFTKIANGYAFIRQED